MTISELKITCLNPKCYSLMELNAEFPNAIRFRCPSCTNEIEIEEEG